MEFVTNTTGHLFRETTFFHCEVLIPKDFEVLSKAAGGFAAVALHC